MAEIWYHDSQSSLSYIRCPSRRLASPKIRRPPGISICDTLRLALTVHLNPEYNASKDPKCYLGSPSSIVPSQTIQDRPYDDIASAHTPTHSSRNSGESLTIAMTTFYNVSLSPSHLSRSSILGFRTDRIPPDPVFSVQS